MAGYAVAMEPPYTRRRAAGALAFLAEVELFARECAATGAWDDELAARRRRQRDGLGTVENREGRSNVKAL
jgi:hypothetical protein